MQDGRTRRFWLARPRVGIRALMVLILAIGCGLGWFVHLARRARIQRLAVAAIRNAGGTVLYDWQFEDGKVRANPVSHIISDQVPGWPKWVVDRVGLEHFGDVRQVTFRRIYAGGFTAFWPSVDEALAHLGNLGQLRNLTLTKSLVTDAGLPHLEGLSNLQTLMLRGCNEVSDAGLSHLRRMTNLKGLWLEDTRITDGGLVSLRGLAQLESLNLARTRVGDAGLAQLECLTRLKFLGLDQTAVTDAGLMHLKRLTSLEELRLNGTKTTDTGVEELRKSLPNLRVGR